MTNRSFESYLHAYHDDLDVHDYLDDLGVRDDLDDFNVHDDLEVCGYSCDSGLRYLEPRLLERLLDRSIA